LSESVDSVSEIKLIRTDTTLDLSQKAEKVLKTLSNFHFNVISGREFWSILRNTCEKKERSKI